MDAWYLSLLESLTLNLIKRVLTQAEHADREGLCRRWRRLQPFFLRSLWHLLLLRELYWLIVDLESEYAQDFVFFSSDMSVGYICRWASGLIWAVTWGQGFDFFNCFYEFLVALFRLYLSKGAGLDLDLNKYCRGFCKRGRSNSMCRICVHELRIEHLVVLDVLHCTVEGKNL